MNERKLLDVTLTIDSEDWENLPLALGYAVGAVLSVVRSNPEIARRAVKRLEAFASAICDTARVTER